MPQLDKFIFIDTSVLTFCSFFLIYIVNNNFILPMIMGTLKFRSKVIAYNKFEVYKCFFENELFVAKDLKCGIYTLLATLESFCLFSIVNKFYLLRK